MKIQCLVVLLIFLGCPSLSAAANIKDSESSTHADEAASYKIVAEYPFNGGKLTQFTLSVLSHYSYILQSGGKALVVDPGRDVATYFDYCKKHNLTVEGVYLSHSHADFVAGHTEIAHLAKVPIYASSGSGAQYQHKPLKEGDSVTIGDISMKILETPGHTPDGLCGLVYSAQGKPVMLLSGDTLFIGSVGRPDLMGGQMAAATLASMMFDSWTKKLSKLPDDVSIFPAHGAGSLCGAHLSDEPTSTIGAQRVANPYLRHTSRSDFIAAVLEGLPEAPQYFKHNAALNKQGPPLINWSAPLKSSGLAGPPPSNLFVVDIREADEYIPSHVPDAVNIGLRGRFESWVGTMVLWGMDLVLVGGTDDLNEAVFRLNRVGYSAKGIVWDDWAKSGKPVRTSQDIPPAELYSSMQQGTGPVVVDVRLPNEWMALRIGNVVNIPLNKLADGSSILDKSQPVVAVCNSAYRSAMALGILEKEGFKNAASLKGGSEAWIKAGYPTYGAATRAGVSSPAVPGREVNLPDRISPSELMRMIMDVPGSFAIVDIRPSAAFSDYSVPGSINIHVADLISDSTHLVGTGPLVIVDRDGSLAMAAGGILSQKTKRRIMVLYGGLEAYWRESGFGSRTPTSASPERNPVTPTVQPKAAPAPEQGVPVKKSRAGC